MRMVGHTCPMCGVAFLIKARFDAHRTAEIPVFAAEATAKRAASDEAWKRRQIAIGRMTPQGEWVTGWRA